MFCLLFRVLVCLILSLFVVVSNLQSQETIDRSYCDLHERILHIIPIRIPIEDMHDAMIHAKAQGFCTLMIGFRGGLNLSAVKISREEPPVVDRDYLESVAEYAKHIGLHVVPEFQFLTHQEHFLKLDYPTELFNLTTYDPRSKIVQKIVQATIDEVVTIFNSPAVHIGHDELAGITSYSKKHFMNDGEEILPVDLFVESVEYLNHLLDERGLETWMWGDMLIEPSEAGRMKSNAFHGHIPGYGKSLREQLSRDIVIFDWHYKDTIKSFTSISLFTDMGFRVIGVSWKNAKNIERFSRYLSKNGGSGIAITTWDLAIDWDIEVFKKRMLETKRLIDSGFIE